jgi:stage II sporulation protein D
MRIFFLVFFFHFLYPVYIKVLLAKLSAGGIAITHPHEMIINRLGKNRTIKIPELSVAIKKGQIFINNRPYLHKEPLIITSADDHDLKLDGNSFSGYFRLVEHDGALMVINHLDLEDYVSSVLKTEAWPGWALPYYNVQAIISRTYALDKIYKNRQNKKSALFDICNTNLHQTYKGSHDIDYIKKAVLDTNGLFLVFNDKPIDAMYDCCCGGVNPSHISDMPYKTAPYLCRDEPCRFCQNTKIYNWQAKIKLADFIAKLKTKFPRIKNITKITLEKDKAKIVKKIKLFDNRKSYTITGKEFYSFYKEVKSFIFDINMEDKLLNVVGRGYGHHRGLCQWGAHEMIKQNFSCQDVLEFYYPKAKVKRIQSA